jgi:mannitol-1-phosphate 5-dehydrogenase
MKKAVMYGAGNIGRGFIGQLLSQSGYEVVFIDVDEEIVDQLNERKSYTIDLVTNDDQETILVENVRAVNGLDTEASASEIAGADIMATAVGAAILPKIAPVIARGLQLRKEMNKEKSCTGNNDKIRALDIIVCENLMAADRYLHDLVRDELNTLDPQLVEQGILTDVGFVETSIGRMVPVTVRDGTSDILRIVTEPYCELPVDRTAFRGEIPNIVHLQPVQAFVFYIQRKLFIHNMSHAVTAYLGKQKNYEFIWQAIQDDEIREVVTGAMAEAAQALARKHLVPLADIDAFCQDLLARFENRALGDTIARVGKDVKRKLATNDRLLGAFSLCIEHDVKPFNILKGIDAALKF